MNAIIVVFVAVVALILTAVSPSSESLSPARALAGQSTPAAAGAPTTAEALTAVTAPPAAATPVGYETLAAPATTAAVAPPATPAATTTPDRAGRSIYVLGDSDTISPEVVGHLASCTTGTLTRLPGREPYEIAAERSRDRFESADVVYVATIDSFGNAPGESIDAGTAEAPVLLVGRDALPAATIAELLRLAPSGIVVVGDDNVVGESVEGALHTYAEHVVRTSQIGTSSATPEPAPDRALAPILVATEDTLPDPTVSRLAGRHTDEAVLVVDTNSVPEATAAEISDLTGVPCEPFEVTVACAAGWVALTYDDGPSPERTDTVLAALEEAGVNATFFTVGYLVETHPATVRKTAGAGHAIANHANLHETLVDLSDAAIAETLNRTDAKIRATGVEPTGLVRPPGGVTNARVKATIERSGYRQIMWTTGPLDYDGKSATAIADDVIAHVQDGAVVVLHDNSNNYRNTAEATGSIVQTLQEQGYCFGVLDGTGSIVP
ncbi:MAG: polysaccharide deacetylase family protein [Actinomycetota bacterium]|nr:polysaccharide deacetylase family protein [Actinomycetota bacterium]